MLHPLPITNVRLLGRFTPGCQAGQPVDVRYVLPIDFTIRTGADWRRHRRTGRRATAAYLRGQ